MINKLYNEDCFETMRITEEDYEKVEELKKEKEKFWRLAEIDIQENAQKENTKEILKERQKITKSYLTVKQKAQELLNKFKEKGCYGGVIRGAYHCFCGEKHKSGKQFYCKRCTESIKICEEILQ